MRKLIVLLAIFAVTGTVAYADHVLDLASYTITATPLDEEIGGPRSPIGWSNIDMAGTLYTASSTGGWVGYEDYQASAAVWPGSTFTLEKFRFIGGVATAGQVLFFDFYHNNVVPDGTNYYDYFGVQFSQAGNWIWTITLSTPKTIDTSGFVDMDASYTASTVGTWYLDTSGPSIGTSANGPWYNGSTPLTTAFELEGTPEPASLLLLSVAGLFFRRR